MRAPPVVADEAKLAIVFTYFFVLFFSTPYMRKKNIFLGHFYFFTKKADFRAFFLHSQRSVAEPGLTPSPWSILSTFYMRFVDEIKIIFAIDNLIYSIKIESSGILI